MRKIPGLLVGSLLLASCAGAPPHQVRLAPVGNEPRGLANYSMAELRAVYGTPAFTRKENGSELWRYDIGACRVFFFLYKDGSSYSVRHVESIPRGRGNTVDENCLNALSLRAKKA
jgi:hypothetical protein